MSCIFELFFTLNIIIYNTCNASHFLNKRKHEMFMSTGKLYTPTVFCDTLKPESITKETTCLSNCVTSKDDENIKCNLQAETWKIRLKVDQLSNFASNEGCDSGFKRFKCVTYESNEGICDDESLLTYPPVYSCFTKCGVKTCPGDNFMEPNYVADLKVADCKSGYRVRCTTHSNAEINSGDLTLELLKY